jgi:tRNA pseudouridine38-40 synthase
MSERTMQLVLHYDGASFSGWQRQPASPTVQAALEDALRRLCGEAIKAVASGRTDAGVHATGQSVGVRVPPKWSPGELRRALNGVLPPTLWVAAATEMSPDFHPRYSAVSRSYSYRVAVGSAARSPFRRSYEYAWRHPVDAPLLNAASSLLVGEHRFAAFAVKGTAPPTDSLRCRVTRAAWAHGDDRLVFSIEANRFLHHMVRYLVGTMLDIASGKRPLGDMLQLLRADDNRGVSPPAPPHGLFLDGVRYPRHLYRTVG